MDNLKKSDIIKWLKADDASELFNLADKTRKQYFNDEVHIRGIVEFSNHCSKDCLYCGLRKSNTKITRYRMEKNEIVNAAVSAGRLGYKTILLQSGEGLFYSIDELCDIIMSIKSKLDCAVTLSLGEKPLSEYKRLKDAGADRYLLRFETSNRELFKKLKPDSSYEKRLNCIHDLKASGFQVGSGFMVGLPGQTYEILADDILLLRDLDLDMIGIGPFIPHHDTPLRDEVPGTLDTTLKALAIIRVLMPDVHIPATTAMGTVEKGGREKALQRGANVIMPNVTPTEYRKYYEIYPNKICITDAPSDCRVCIEGMLKSSGRTIATHRGDSIKNHENTSNRGNRFYR
jgi:biotin synthase